MKGQHSYNIRDVIILLSEWRCSWTTAILHERQYNQFFILKVYALELKCVKQNTETSLWTNMRAYELHRLSSACHILVQVTSVKSSLSYMRTRRSSSGNITTIFMLLSESSQFHTVVFQTCLLLTLRSSCLMWTPSTAFTADLGLHWFLKSVSTHLKLL